MTEKKEISVEVLTTFLDKQVEEDLGDRKDLETLSVNIPHANSKYLRYLHDQGLKHLELKSDWDRLYRVKYDLYRYNYKYTFSNKAECEVYINGDEEIIELKNKIEKSELILKHLEGIIKMLGQTSFNIRNALEYRKMNDGYL